jgi:hypothetical protein
MIRSFWWFFGGLAWWVSALSTCSFDSGEDRVGVRAGVVVDFKDQGVAGHSRQLLVEIA